MKFKYCIFGLIIAILLISRINGQTIDLDQKYGYKDFKIGDRTSKWLSSSTYQTTYNGTTVYKYNGTNYTDAFDFKVKEISLAFYNDSLASIFIEVRIPTSNESNPDKFYFMDFVKAKESMVKYIGEPTTESLGNGKKISYQWVKSKIVLSLQGYNGGIDGNDEVVIEVSSKRYLEAIMNSKF